MSSENISNIILERLNRIDGRLSNIEHDVSGLKKDMGVVKESIRRIDSRMAAMDAHLAGFHNTQLWQNDEIDALKGRVEALEDNPPDKTPE